MITASDIFHFCSITTDIWLSQSMHSFISTTLHFIDNNWKPKMVVMKCFPIDESHTGQHIADVLGNIMAEWKLNHSKLHVVLRDNAPTMVKAMTLNGCFLHTLQLIVDHSIFEQSGVKLMMTRANKLVSYFKHSPKAMYILHKHQKALHEEDGGYDATQQLNLGRENKVV